MANSAATLTALDPSRIRSLCARPGPVASVYFDLRATTVDEALPRWRSLADVLVRQGAAPATVDAAARHVVQSVPGPGVTAVFAGTDDVVESFDIPGSDQADLAAYEGVAHVLPLLAWLQDRPAYVTAVVDRTGADVTAHPVGTTAGSTTVVEGPDDEIERNAPGGWSQRRYQNRAEDSWEHNAAQVAHLLARTLDRVEARLLLISGDVRAVQLVEKHLPHGVRRTVTVRHLSGGRSPDGSWQRREEQVADEVRLSVDEETAGLLERFAEDRRPGGRAVEAVRPTLTALRRGRVQTLLLVADGGRRTAWYGPAPADVSARRADLTATGSDAKPAPLLDVAIRAALHTGAAVRVLTAGTGGAPAEGVGALCRYPVP